MIEAWAVLSNAILRFLRTVKNRVDGSCKLKAQYCSVGFTCLNQLAPSFLPIVQETPDIT